MDPCNSILLRHEEVHKTNLKEGWNTSNHNFNYLPHVITSQSRIPSFLMRLHNLQAISQCQEDGAAACKVLSCSADEVFSLSLKSYAKPESMGLHNHSDGQHLDIMINDFRALLENMQDAIHHLAILNATREFTKYMSCNKTYISDVQLHKSLCCILHCITVQVEYLEGEHISLMC